MSCHKETFSKGIVSGVFDNFHPGHEYFLREAKKLCDELTVVVTLPQMVVKLKGNAPKNSFEDRVTKVKEFNPELVVIPSDAVLGEWSVFEKHTYDIVILGYDQKGIANELDKINVPYMFLQSHHPQIYKSSLYK